MKLFQLPYATRHELKPLSPPTHPATSHTYGRRCVLCTAQRKENCLCAKRAGLPSWQAAAAQRSHMQKTDRQAAAHLCRYMHIKQLSWKPTATIKEILLSWCMDIQYRNVGHSNKLPLYYKIHLADNPWKRDWRIRFHKCYTGCWPMRSLIIHYLGKYGWSSWQPHKRSNTLTFFFSAITQIAWAWWYMDGSQEEASWQSLMTISLLRDYFHTKA